MSPSPDLVRSSTLSCSIVNALSHVVLLFVWIAVVTPLALWQRLRGREASRKRSDRGARSYREPYEQGKGAETYSNQF